MKDIDLTPNAYGLEQMRLRFWESENTYRYEIAALENLADACDDGGAIGRILKTGLQADLLGEALQLLIAEKQRSMNAVRDGYDECARCLGHDPVEWSDEPVNLIPGTAL